MTGEVCSAKGPGRPLGKPASLPAPRGTGVALVTGASSGIGEAFAREFSRRGKRVVLVARRQDRLAAIANQIRADGCQADIAPADLRDLGAIDALLADLDERGLAVDVLVNNAGFGVWGTFADQDLSRQLDEIRLHVLAPLTLTHAVLPGMVSRGQGVVINVASSAALLPMPYMAVYAASKACLHSFSQALAKEVRAAGVRVVVVNPGSVPTEFGQVSGLPIDDEPGPAVSPAQVVKEALSAVHRGRRAVVPGRRMRLFMRASKLAPIGLQLAVVERAYRPDRSRR